MKKPLWIVKARETFVCPICHWRVTGSQETAARSEFRFHMKHEHNVKGTELRLNKP